MSETRGLRKRSAWTVVVAASLVLVALYIGGYFAIGQYARGNAGRGRSVHLREFPHSWFVISYYPLGWLESQFRNSDRKRNQIVLLQSDGDLWGRNWIENLGLPRDRDTQAWFY